MKRTPLRKASTKQAAKLREYSKLRNTFLADHPVCSVCQCSNSQDVHHMDGRGVNLNRVDTWLAVCRDCHLFITRHPNTARKKGWLK